MNFLFALASCLISVAVIAYKVISGIRNNIHINSIIKELPYYTPVEIRTAIKYYIDTNCQSVSPSIANEPSQPYAFVPKEKLIPFFLEKAFTSKDGDYKYYILLADSGMGKTTFMINLFFKYKRSYTPDN